MVLPMEISRYGSASKWQMNERGEWVMPEKQAQFLEWLMADIRIPETMLEWAEANDLHKDTPVRWKQDKRFIEKWEEAARKKNISMDRVQSVIDSIYEQAANGNIKAASLYLQYVDRFTPTQRVITEDEQVAKLSDEELDEQLRALLND